MRKATSVVALITAVCVGLYVYAFRSSGSDLQVIAQPLSRGDIVDVVATTGTLQAVETVQVGTQVSGVVAALYADFNSIVKKGQVIARLDPQLIDTQIEQQQANVGRAEADLERNTVSIADAQQKLDRASQLFAKSLIPKTDLETAQVALDSAQAQLRSSEAALAQARAQLSSSRVNLSYTTIRSPIDGIVISRNVDAGQTVAASMNAPTLYVLAADLTRMEVVANVDESDVGRMRPGQPVTFRVDAFPTDVFTGVVSQVRLQPSVVQNVVTYSTVIEVPNPELKLKPGMTANANIEVARRNNVLRIANTAMRFRPTRETFAALHQPVPPELDRPRAAAGAVAAVGTAGQGTEPAIARVADTRPVPSPAKTGTDAMTLDSLFAPVQISETRGIAWLYDNGQLKPLRLRLGISDGTFTEVLNAEDVQEGARVATNVMSGAAATQNRSTSPLMGPQPGAGRGFGGRG